MSDNPFALSNIQQDSEGGTAPAGSNPFALSAIQSDQRQDQRVLLRQAIATNPDEAAKAAKLAKQYPVPEDMLARNLRDVEMQAAVDKADEQLQTSPRLAQYLRDKPFTAKQAHDDVAALAKLEQDTKQFGALKAWDGPEVTAANIASGLAKSVPQGFETARLGMQAQMGDFLDWLGVTESDEVYKAAQQRKLAQASGASAFTTPDFESDTARGVYGGAASFLRMLPATVLSVATRSPTPMLVTAGAQTQAEAYAKYRGRGGGAGESFVAATGEGAVEVATEFFGSKYLAQALGKTGAGEFLVGVLAREVPGEQLATLFQDAIDTAVANPDKTWGEYLQERPDAAYQTFVATITQSAIMGGINAGATRVLRRAQEQDGANRSADQLQAAMQTATSSLLRERNPDEFRALVQSMADNTDGAPKEVFVDAEVLNQLAPELLAQLPESVRAALPDALAANDAVAIPVGDVLTLAPGTPLEAMLVENARLNGPESMSQAEAKQASAQAQEFLATESQRVIQQAVDQQATQESHDRVKQTLLERLNTVGRDSPAVNTTTATLYASMYTTLAGQLGITPEATFQLYGVNLVGKTGQGAVLNTGRPGEIAVEGYHFSTADRPMLTTAAYGTGLKGSARDEILNHPDQRLRQRLSFYFDKGTGIRPESGVGGRAHRVPLTGIYDADADPLKLKSGDARAFESKLLDLGYSGYANRMDGTQPGQVIMLGAQTFTPELLGAQSRIDTGQRLAPLPTAAPQWKTQASGDPAMLAAKLERMQGMPAWADYEMRIDGRELQVRKKEEVLNQSLSSRLPSSVKSTEDPLASVLNITYDVVLADTKTLSKNVAALQALPNMRKLKGKGAKDPVRNVEAFIEHATNNLLWLHDHMPASMRDRARLWYDGGRKTVEAWAKRYGISEMQGAAAIAVLSPQNGWFANVSQAERIADMVFGLREYVWDDAMTAEAERISEGGQLDDKMQTAVGKSLGELLATPDIAARWARIYDQAHNSRAYHVLTPEGGAADYVKTGAGADATMMWKSYSTIAKAISVLTDGRAENVHYQIGKEHKVRNFYNNIFAPNSELGYATIDTHAVAAALLRPLASADIEVAQAFGGGGSSSSAMTGLNGTYPIYLEAYRRAAEARGIQPRQMQSITWEAVRGLFEATAKRGMKAPANAIWERYKAGDIEQAQAQQEILALAGDITPPAWTEVPFDDTVNRTYEGAPQVAVDSRPAAEGTESKVMFEVAPDPNDEALTAEWNALTPAERLEISQRVATRVVPEVLKELGTGGDFVMQLGGYLGATNPSMTLRLERSELALTAAKMLGHALSQDSMMVVAETPFVGSEPVGAVTLLLPDGYGETEVSALYDRLWQLKNEQGQELVGGHTTSDGRMVILNYSSLSTEELGEVIDAHLGGEFEVTGDTVYSAFPTKEDYGYDVQNEPEGNTASRQSPAQRRPSDLRAAAAESLRAELDARRGAQADGTYAQAGDVNGRPESTGDRGGRYSSGSLAPLEGAPTVADATGPDARLVAVAEQYAADNGIGLKRQAEFVEVDPARAKRIADAYAAMPHAPQDPAVKEAYENLIRQTVAQYRALEAAGYQFYLVDETNDPYAGNPWNAMRDLRANQTMGVFATEAGFGSNAEFDPTDNPLLADTGIRWPYGSLDGESKRVLANDLFRAVHDAFGHGLEGAGFRARGEENAWQAHVRLFTGSAVGAITSETRGQNSWLNYGPNGESNQTAKVEDTVFADQKTGLMPEWTWAEGRAGDQSEVLNQTQRGAESFETTYTDKQGETYTIRLEQEVLGMGADRALTVRVAAFQGDQRRARVDFDVQGNTLAAENTITAPAYRGRGLAEALYSAAREAGYDIMPGRKQTPDGEAMVARLREKGLINQERPLGQGANALMSWFGTPGPDNNMVNEDGTPMVLYHGTTKAAVESLKSGSPFRRSKTGAMGPAVYLGDSAEASAGYNNGALIRVYARGKYLSNAKWSEYVGQHGWAGAEAAARADGYAGVYDRNFENAIAVWDPANIKAVDAAEFAETDNAYQQGPRGTFNPKTFELALNENSNMSTVHHEMGHAYLEIITKIASEPNAPQAIVDQVERFLKWRGITGDETVGGTDSGAPLAQRDNFTNWFGNSKVVDAEGKPLVVYHGTAADIDAFDLAKSGSLTRARSADGAFWFSDSPELAGDYAALSKKKLGKNGARNVMPVFLKMENPKIVDMAGKSYHELAVDFGAMVQTARKGVRSGTDWVVPPHDGMILRNFSDTPSGRRLVATHYVAFRPEQIKSATGNNGSFDANESNILKQGDQPPAPAAPITPKRTALETWNAMTLDQKRPHHEALAENYENYLLTGKAPSLELQPLFRKLKAYMLNAYKTLKAFFAANPDVTQKLPPEMVQFYDRMLASEEQIAQAEEVAGLLPDEDATTEAVEKLTARSLRDLKWTVNARNKAIKALQKEAATLRKAVEAEVTAEVDAMPEFAAKRALDAIKKATKAAPSDMEQATIADSFGYPSVDAMLEAIAAAGKKADVIEGMTDQRMLEEHGDLIDQRAIEQAANEAVHNEARARSLATELRAQAEALNPRADTGGVNAKGSKITVNAIAEAAKQFAENVVAKTPLKDLKAKAWQHTAAERRAAKRWQDATAKGETQEAVKAKQDQLLNNAAAKAALEAQGEMRKVLEFFKRVVKDGNEKTVTKGRDPDVVNAARAILGAYGVAPRGAKTATEYMDLVAKNDPAMYAALQPSTQAALNAAQPLEALTMDELRALHEEIQAMWHLAKRSRQMEVDGNLLDIEDAADELQGRMQEIGVPDSVPGDTRAITPAEKRARWLQHAGSLLRRAEQWAEGMDGKFGGPFLRLVFQPVKEAANRYRADRVKYRKAYQALVDAVAPALRKGPIAAPEINYTFGEGHNGIGHAELLHAILHTGNDSNKRKLLLGRGWATENADGTLDTSKWDAFTTRMQAEGLLTKAHYDFAQGVWDLLEQTKPLAQKTHRDVFGRYFAEVTADEVVTPFGTYRGGYVPAQADPELVQDADLRKLAELENENMSYSFPATSKGFTKGRVEYNRPLLLNLRTIGQHLDKVLLFSHMEPAVRDVNKLLSQKGVSYSLGRIDQTVYAGMLTPWLNRSARQIVETPILGDGGISRVLSAARGRAGMALMFANISNTLQQITGFSTAFAKLKADGLESHMMRATAQFISNPKEMGRSVAAASSFMDNRMENEIAAINDAMDDILLDQSLYEKSQAWTRKHAYFMQTAMANTMEPIIWTAGYNGALQKGMSETDAVRYADGLVRQTQGSTLPEDVSRIETGPAYARVFTQFIGYFNMMANTNATALKQIAQETGLKKGAGKALLVVTAGMLVPLWVAEAIAQAMRGGPDDEDDDGYLDDWLAAVFGMGTIKGSLAMVPFVGQLANAGINRMNSNPADDKVSLSPAVSLLESGVGVPKLVYQAMTDPDKINARNAVRDVASAISITTGLPAYAIARPLGYLAGVADNRIEPTSAADAVRGAITGSASPDSK